MEKEFIIMLIIRTLVAFICGAAIGIERNFRGKQTGVRTHGTICCAACLFVLLSAYVSREISETLDITYLAEQIINGIVFLGVGVIIIRKNNYITGLHTACGIWATAAIGMACGCGMLALAGLSVVIIIFIQSGLHRMIIDRSVFITQDIRITTTNLDRLWELLKSEKVHHRAKVIFTEVSRGEDDTLTIFIRLMTPRPISAKAAMEFKDRHNEIKAITV